MERGGCAHHLMWEMVPNPLVALQSWGPAAATLMSVMSPYFFIVLTDQQGIQGTAKDK